MVIVKLMGGVGNQMFQYAIARSLSIHLHTTFKLDLDFLLDRTPRANFVFRDYDLGIFKLKAERASEAETKQLLRQPPAGLIGKLAYKIENRIAPHKYFFEPHYHFAPEVFRLPANCYLEGYWQSPLYFQNIESELRKDFEFSNELPSRTQDLVREITSVNSVCIHVRRTDYINNSFHGMCDMNYFLPSIDIMTSRVSNPHFYVFSDDPEWCYENFRLNFPVTVIGHAFKGLKFSDDLHLMSLCKHFIIPNSSFSWWATWLNGDKNKIVIAPKLWFADKTWDSKDLIPDTWIRVANS